MIKVNKQLFERVVEVGKLKNELTDDDILVYIRHEKETGNILFGFFTEFDRFSPENIKFNTEEERQKYKTEIYDFLLANGSVKHQLEIFNDEHSEIQILNDLPDGHDEIIVYPGYSFLSHVKDLFNCDFDMNTDHGMLFVPIMGAKPSENRKFLEVVPLNELPSCVSCDVKN